MTASPTMLRDDYVRVIEAENDALRARVAALEAELTAGFVAPIEWRLTSQEAIVFRVMVARPLATKEAILTALYRDLNRDEAEPKIVDVFICKLRKKTRPFGIEIRTHWGQGFSLPDDVRARFRKAKHQEAA